jgi:hypothetical protein
MIVDTEFVECCYNCKFWDETKAEGYNGRCSEWNEYEVDTEPNEKCNFYKECGV